MAYASFSDLQYYSGFIPSDFRYLFDQMDISQYETFCNSLLETATNIINRYCGVETFEQHEVTNEYHSLQLLDAVGGPYGGYPLTPPAYYGSCSPYFTPNVENLSQVTIFPRDIPCQSVNTVEVTMGATNGVPEWITLTERTGDQDGDYVVINQFGVTQIILLRRYPQYGINKIRISYTAGYPEGAPALDTMNLACCMVATNIMNYKKKQEMAATAFGSGVQNFGPSFSFAYGSDHSLLSNEVRSLIDQYRRPMDPSGYI